MNYLKNKLVLLGLLLYGALLFAAEKDLSEKTQNLLLAKKRMDAIRLLLTQNSKEAKSLLNEAARVFLTERGQMLFTTADAQVESKSKEALEILQEAQSLEAGNLEITLLQLRILLKNKDCEGALKVLEPTKSIAVGFPELRLMRVQALECQQKYADAEAILLVGDFSGFDWIVKLLQTRLSVKRDKRQEGQRLADIELNKIQSPEGYFWRYRLAEKKSFEAKEAARKYQKLCTSMGRREKKRFDLDISLCQGLAEVEEFLSSQNGEHSSPPVK